MDRMAMTVTISSRSRRVGDRCFSVSTCSNELTGAHLRDAPRVPEAPPQSAGPRPTAAPPQRSPFGSNHAGSPRSRARSPSSLVFDTRRHHNAINSNLLNLRIEGVEFAPGHVRPADLGLLWGQGDCPCQPPEREGGLFGARGEQVVQLADAGGDPGAGWWGDGVVLGGLHALDVGRERLHLLLGLAQRVGERWGGAAAGDELDEVVDAGFGSVLRDACWFGCDST